MWRHFRLVTALAHLLWQFPLPVNVTLGTREVRRTQAVVAFLLVRVPTVRPDFDRRVQHGRAANGRQRHFVFAVVLLVVLVGGTFAFSGNGRPVAHFHAHEVGVVVFFEAVTRVRHPDKVRGLDGEFELFPPDSLRGFRAEVQFFNDTLFCRRVVGFHWLSGSSEGHRPGVTAPGHSPLIPASRGGDLLPITT